MEDRSSKIQAIEYKPWVGERTGYFRRIFVMTSSIFLTKLKKSKGIKILLLLGMLLVHAFPLLFQPLLPHETLEAEVMRNHLNGNLLFIFTILLTSVAASDLIAQDLQSNSFALYFSRPLRPGDYILGKFSGLFSILALFCLIPLLTLGVAMIGTQSSTNYIASLEILGRTILAGFFVSMVFIPYGLMVSSLTENETYAGVGSFIGFFVMGLVAGIFSNFDPNWKLIDPSTIVGYTVNLLFETSLPESIEPALYASGLLVLMVVPLLIIWFRIYWKAIGK
ncbi:MAG: ABC transporter permease subunit [Candidatus Korarchaeota archaeon]|nr:ABC transporter permease subunit [Candidatus Korarchaeota archaeon]NIU84845.1 ABC transporter permease subunit [Candidatus Thorarchaeota archaeon]NIW14863.1 ABC transporter permease subunit [Candidatus Thorarchaeota archaeon]NIW52904.1 ABC transporter permease subunit [Candidatus Korarchaeota archaeon]